MAIRIKIAVLLIVIAPRSPESQARYVLELDVYLRTHNACSAEIETILSERIFRLNEAAPGREAVTPMQV